MTESVQGRLSAYREAGRVPCASAFRIAEACCVAPGEVRESADAQGLRVTECQLGLFGYDVYGEKRWARRLASVPRPLESAVRAACVGERLPCAAAWRLADAEGLPRLLVGSVAETLGVRISDCQLGCFE